MKLSEAVLESEIVNDYNQLYRRVCILRATLAEEATYLHWTNEQRNGIERALKWFDECMGLVMYKPSWMQLAEEQLNQAMIARQVNKRR